MLRTILTVSLIILFGLHGLCYSESKLISVKINDEPVIDGNGQDPIWAQAPEIITRDDIADLDIAIKSVYTDEKLFFRVRFDDPDESRFHKPWIWSQHQNIYQIGPDREDCLVFKWAMDPEISDLSLQADAPYAADIWFWKANRTDPAGYADDKIQRLSLMNVRKSMKLQSKAGTPMFLRRIGDKGRSAYKATIYVDYSGDQIPQFKEQRPTGSRADIRAKGAWDNNQWCIEFSRSLKTGQDDDIQFDVSQSYFFGVSRYEVAGKKPDPKLSQPLYGAGDVSERLYLIFGH